MCDAAIYIDNGTLAPMEVSSRPAVDADIPRLVSLYKDMETEQTVRKPIWALTDGLDTSFDASLASAMASEDSYVSVGEIDGSSVAFCWATIETMLERAEGQLVGRLRLIYTEPEARGVGVGHTMLTDIRAILEAREIRHFDAPVGPGQRAAKNFFEAHGFAARSIIMYSASKPENA